MTLTTFPIETVPPAANLITFAPVGTITSTDVQAAIAELEASIPTPGTGTDPLFLTQGLDVSTLNPVGGTGPNDRRGTNLQLVSNATNMSPEFGNAVALALGVNTHNGQQNYNSDTQVKLTFINLSNFAEHYGAGQRFLLTNNIYGYGMGDLSVGQNLVEYHCGPTAGDEGQGFSLVARLGQPGYYPSTTIFAVGTDNASGCNTTTTQAITKSMSAQTVTVVSSTGIAANDWVCVERMVGGGLGLSNTEAVKITAVTPTTITGVFRCNHDFGVTITPTLILHLNNHFAFGQERIIINHDQLSYSTGTIASISGGGVTGLGTNWTTGMVGGDAINIGAIAFMADDFTGSAFDQFTPARPARSWYVIYNLVSTTNLGAFSFSTSGDTSLRTKAPAGGNTYLIKPCAKILMVETSGGSFTGRMICETSTSTWAAGNFVECPVCPYPDVSGHIYHVNGYTVGGNYRSFMEVRNIGPRMFETGLAFTDPISTYTFFGPGGGDPLLWRNAISISGPCEAALRITSVHKTAAISLGVGVGNPLAQNTDSGGRIMWDGGFYLGPVTNGDLANFGGFQLSNTGGFSGSLRIIGTSGVFPSRSSSLAGLDFDGYMALIAHAGNSPFFNFDKITGGTNYERLEWKWLPSGEFVMGSIKGGTGTVRDMIFQTAGTDRLRMDALGNIVTGSAAIATNATDGFLFIPTCAGPPTGVPSFYAGRVAVVYDTTNNKFYVYSGGWKGGTTPGAWT